MNEFDARPPRLATAIAVVAGGLAVLFTAPGGTTAMGFSALGIPVLGLGAFRGQRRYVSIGGLVIASGTLVGGLFGAPVVSVVVAMAATYVAWDVGEHGVGLGEQVGHRARSRNAVVSHAAASTAVAAVTSIVATVLYTVGPSGRPFGALLLLLVGAVLLTLTLSD